MSRIVPAVAAGLILSQVVAMVGWWWGFYISPPSLLYDMSPTLAHAHPGGLGFGALFWQALGQGLGALAGGLWALRIARDERTAAWAVGGASFVLAIVWAVLFPRPFWFFALSGLMIGAGAWAAGRIAAGGPWRAV